MGAWSLIGVIWGNTVGSYIDDFYLNNLIYEWDSYYDTEITLYESYPNYKTAFNLKTFVNFVNTVIGIVLFRDWHSHV